MKRLFTFSHTVLFVIAISFFVFNKSTFAFTLVREGTSDTTIVVAQEASEQVQKAAQILKKYIQQSTGAQLPIENSASGRRIYIGQTPETIKAGINVSQLDQEGFILQGIDEHQYAIVGASDWGTEFGVYDFLERYLGVRWLMPTELGIDIPQHSTVDIPGVKVAQEPAYLMRRLSPIFINSNNPLGQWGRFNRANGRIAFSHNLLKLFPPSKFGKTHPEFYPLIDGKRYIPTTDTDYRWQPNLTAPGIVDAAVKQIDEYFQQYPDRPSYSLGMNDSNNWDQSPASKDRRTGGENILGYEDVSDEYFAWANAVVEKVLLKYPDKWFGTLAYNGNAEPPTKVKVHPRIIPFMTYDRIRWEDAELRAMGQNLTERWAKVSPMVGWYDYVYGRNYLLPRVDFHRMQQYLSWGANHQVRYYYAELYPNWGEGPKPWVTTKLLWDPHQDVDALLDDWYNHFAGQKAAPELKDFYAIWEKFWTVDIAKSAWNRKDKQYWPFHADPTYLLDVPESYVTESDKAMQAALQLADTPQRKARVAKLKQMWDFYKASILTYQGEHFATHTRLTTPEEALDLLDKAEKILPYVAQREQLLIAFAKDRIYSPTAGYINQYSTTRGGAWATSLLWRVQPWATKDKRVKERLIQLAESSDATVRQSAQTLLQIINRNFNQVSTNASFEDGTQGWRLWDKANEIATFQRGTWTITNAKAYSGKQSLLISGLQRGGPIKNIRYQPGAYFARAYCYVPAKSKVGSATLSLGVSPKKGKKPTLHLPSSNLPLRPGQWASIIIPFELPVKEAKDISSISVLLTLDGFEPDGKVYVDSMGIYRIGDNQ